MRAWLLGTKGGGFFIERRLGMLGSIIPLTFLSQASHHFLMFLDQSRGGRFVFVSLFAVLSRHARLFISSFCYSSLRSASAERRHINRSLVFAFSLRSVFTTICGTVCTTGYWYWLYLINGIIRISIET